MTDINPDFLTKIGGDSSLLTMFGLDLGRLPPTSVDGKLTTEKFWEVQMKSLFLYLAGNQAARDLYMKKRPSSPSDLSTITQSSSPSKKTKTKENKFWAKTVARLTISTADPTFTAFELGRLRDFLDKGFDEDGYSGKHFYQHKKAVNTHILPHFGVSVFKGVTNIPCTQAHMTAFFKGSFCTYRPERERKGTLSLGCYNPPSKEVQKRIEDAETKASLDAALDQAP